MTYFKTDVLNDDLADALEGSDTVLSCLGVGNDPATLLDPPPLFTDGTVNIAYAMKQAGIDRLAVISASFVETFERGPLHFRATLPALSRVFKQMERMEAHLADQETLRWTAVRPGWIMDAPPSEHPIVTENTIREDLVRSRTGDIANVLLDAVQHDKWVHAKPAVASEEPDEDTSIEAVAEEII